MQPKFNIEYTLKVIGGSTGTIPGLGDMIEVDTRTKKSMMYIFGLSWLLAEKLILTQLCVVLSGPKSEFNVVLPC